MCACLLNIVFYKGKHLLAGADPTAGRLRKFGKKMAVARRVSAHVGKQRQVLDGFIFLDSDMGFNNFKIRMIC